jgi:hypothetical protein
MQGAKPADQLDENPERLEQLKTAGSRPLKELKYFRIDSRLPPSGVRNRAGSRR